MIRSFYQKHHRTWEKYDQFLFNNPILERGLVIAPIVVTCTSLSNALTLSAAFACITILTIAVTYAIPKKLPYTIRVILNAAIAALMFLPVSMAVRRWQPEAVYQLGVYLPLLATNSLIVQKSESRYHRQKFPVMLAQLATASLGFAAVAVLTGTVREILGKGMLLGRPIEGITWTVPSLLLPFGGFLLVGFLAALLQKFRLWMEKPPRKPQKEEQHHV